MSKPQSNIIPETGTTLFLDIGHSSIKAAFQEGLEWKNPKRFELKNAREVVEWINRHQHDFSLVVVVSVVSETTEALLSTLDSIPVRVFGNQDIPPELLRYDTPESLGLDRFFACYGAVAHTSRAVVVIDSGTACTVDYMTDNYMFMGGVILPGIGIVEKSLKKYVPNLPAVPRSVPDVWPGKSTRDSLQWGMAGMYRETLKGIIRHYERDLDHFELILTGGDVEWIQSLIDREAKIRPMLVFEGMKRFLEDYL